MSAVASLKTTKFLEHHDLVRGLDLGEANHRAIFRQIARCAGEMAKSGLYVIMVPGWVGSRIDAFNFITLKKTGEPKVFVQDLDTIRLSSDVQFNWRTSITNILRVVSEGSNVPFDSPAKKKAEYMRIAKQIADEAGREMGLEA